LQFVLLIHFKNTESRVRDGSSKEKEI